MRAPNHDERPGLTQAIVTSNGQPIPYSPRYFGAMRETDLATIGDDDLRARYRAEGYVLLRKFLPASAVETLRDAYLGLYRAASAAGGVLPGHGVKGHPAFEFVRGATFRRFVEQPVFRDFADRLTGAVAVPIRRTPLRHFPAGSGIASRAHIDGTYINGAPTDIVDHWLEHRNTVPRWESFLERNIIIDTVEVSAGWSTIGAVYEDAVAALQALPGCLNGSAHSSHAYRSGLNLYFSFAVRTEAAEAMEALESMAHITGQDEIEEHRLKKLKLRMKDQMNEIISRHRAQHV